MEPDNKIRFYAVAETLQPAAQPLQNFELSFRKEVSSIAMEIL